MYNNILHRAYVSRDDGYHILQLVFRGKIEHLGVVDEHPEMDETQSTGQSFRLAEESEDFANLIAIVRGGLT